MQNAYTDIRSGHILPGFLSFIQNPGQPMEKIREAQGWLAGMLGIGQAIPFYKKSIPPGGRWGEKNDVSFDAFYPAQAIPCKPIHVWRMILQENKIRK
jgi:hypothetical protein